MDVHVSVIVPVFNAEKWIRRCVDSLLCQTMPCFELILVDDGSLDGSGAICDAYAVNDSRVRVIHQQNGGVSSARQAGLEAAHGEYVIHADSDDWVEPDMLELLYAKAKEEDADMVICDFLEEYQHQKRYNRQRPASLDNDSLIAGLFGPLHGSCSNKLVRRTCFKQYNLQFDRDLSFCEDKYMIVSLLLHPVKVTYLPKAFYHYDLGVNPSSLVNSHTVNDFNYNVLLFNKFSTLLQGHPAARPMQMELGSKIVQLAFFGKLFTLEDFCQKTLPYKPYACYNLGRPYRLVLSLVYRQRFRLARCLLVLYGFLKKIKQTFVKESKEFDIKQQKNCPGGGV